MKIEDLERIGKRAGETDAECLSRVLEIPERTARVVVNMASKTGKLATHGMKPPSAEERKKIAAAVEDSGGRTVRRGPRKRGSSGRVGRHGMKTPSRAQRDAAGD